MGDAGLMKDESNQPDNRRVTMQSGMGVKYASLMDSREVDIGDRIRLTKTVGSASDTEVWETRTVDSVTYSVYKDKDSVPISRLLKHSRFRVVHQRCTMTGLEQWKPRCALGEVFVMRAQVNARVLLATQMLTAQCKMHLLFKKAETLLPFMRI